MENPEVIAIWALSEKSNPEIKIKNESRRMEVVAWFSDTKLAVLPLKICTKPIKIRKR